MRGYPDGNFKPENEVTRAELATMILNALDYSKKYEDKNIGAYANDISGHWAEGNIAKLMKMGLIKGYPNGGFAPEDTATRAEVVKILDSANISLDERNDVKKPEEVKPEEGKEDEKEKEDNKEEEAKKKVKVSFTAGHGGEISGGNTSYEIKKDTKGINKFPLPEANENYEFEGWLVVDKNEVYSQKRARDITVDENITLQASFLRKEISNNVKSTKDGIQYIHIGTYKNPETGSSNLVDKNLSYNGWVSNTGSFTERNYDWNNDIPFNQIGEYSYYGEVYDYDIAESKNFKTDSVAIVGYEGGENVSLEIPEKIDGYPVKIIKESAFERRGIKNIKIPNTVVEIGYDAFAGNKLSEVILPDSLIVINNSSFYDNSLKEIVLPKSLKYLGTSCFENNRLEKVDFTKAKKLYKISGYTFENNNINNIEFNDTLKYIEYSAFKGNNLTTINFPSSLKGIGSEAFYKNRLTGELTLPNSIKSIESQAFCGRIIDSNYGENDEYGNSISKVNFPSSISQIGTRAFAYNELSEVVLPDELEYIDYEAFRNNKIEKVKFPSKLIGISSQAFENNRLSEQNFELPNLLKSIGESAFNNNLFTEEPVFPESLESLYYNAFGLDE